MKLNYDPRLTAELVAKGIFRSEPFSLIDVGASGGISSHWNVFADSLKAVGFDPLISEVNRLNAEQKNRNVRYRAAMIGFRRFKDLLPDHHVPSNDAYQRSSGARAQEFARQDYSTTYYDRTHEGSTTSELIELDEYFLRDNPSDVDFIKTDTDGHDIEVILGGKTLLQTAPVMGLMVEASFLGQLHESTNLFVNVDIYLRNLGFSIFDMDPARYTRAALPRQFQWRLPANTVDGQIVWADFLYLRDAGIDGYEATWNLSLSGSKLLKLCCLYEMFSLQDCAAEILLKYRDRLANIVDVDHCLDVLTPPLPNGRKVGYRDYIAFFEKNVEAFYPKP